MSLIPGYALENFSSVGRSREQSRVSPLHSLLSASWERFDSIFSCCSRLSSLFGFSASTGKGS